LETFQQLNHKPFYHFPLAQEFGFKGTILAANAVLAGPYDSNRDIPRAELDLLHALERS